MAAKNSSFTEEEMHVDQSLGYPKAYAKLCNNSRSFTNPFINGPPLSFIPYTLQPQEALRAKDMNQMFPVVDKEAMPTANPRGYVNLLWKQLDHLGNAGFDPTLFRVDPYGNVLYLHADLASPLAWDIDHWFPCSRGGKTVPSNLRLLQWQVCQKKKSKLEFLVPWWDLQLGISVNQFISIFASKNSDFRNRAFAFLFLDGSNEELHALQAVDSHKFPRHFIEMKKQVGLAPAAIVSTQRTSESSILKPLDLNKSLRPCSPFPGIKKFASKEDDALNMAIQRSKSIVSKENDNPDDDDFSTNPYFSITRARDSLKQREESKQKEIEISQLDDELNEISQLNESERIALQDLEAMLIKKRRRVEKCRRLSEAQSSYRAMLEKMIRDAMHQSVVYKEQIRLNQAATSTLMARLEAQRAICNKSENELRKKLKHRDELEKQIMRPCWEEQARKRSRMDHTLIEEKNEDCVNGWTPLRKELRVFLDEEQKASLNGEEEKDDEENLAYDKMTNKCKALILGNSETNEPKKKIPYLEKKGRCEEANDERLLDYKLRKLAIRDNNIENDSEKKSLVHEICADDRQDEDEHLKEVGKGNIDKWLKVMLDNAKEETSSSTDSDTIQRLDEINPEKELKFLKLKPLEDKTSNSSGRKSFEKVERDENKGVFENLESSRGFRSVPSSPTMVLMRRSVECIGKKPKVKGDDENVENFGLMASNSGKFIKTCTRTIKRAVNI